MKPRTDDEIIEGIKAGKPWAIKIIEGWSRIVVRTRLWKERGQADDIVQDTVIKVWRHVKDGIYQRKTSLRSYVYVITKGTLLNAIDRWGNIHGHEEQTDDESETNKKEHGLSDPNFGDRDCLERILDLISEDCRKLVEMHLVEGFAYGEMTETHQTSEKAIKQRFFQCRKKTREIGRELGCLD